MVGLKIEDSVGIRAARLVDPGESQVASDAKGRNPDLSIDLSVSPQFHTGNGMASQRTQCVGGWDG